MKRNALLSAIGLTFSSAFLFACSASAVSTDSVNQVDADIPKNIIMVVADGMGPAYVSAYRYFKDDRSTPLVEPIIFDDMLLGTVQTYPHQQSGFVTDSAASATALAAGVKTYNGAVGVTVDKEPVETVLHRARKMGMGTGLAVTSTIVHATPASYMVANEQRRNYFEIADSFFDDRIDGRFLADVMLGAGVEHFAREDRNVIEDFQNSGFQYVDTYEQLTNVDLDKPLLGLFGSSSLPWALDDSDPYRLSTLTKAALSHLNHKNDKGFFLLVEASQVDWAGHANEIGSAMAEMHDLAVTLEVLAEFGKNNPDTLVLITADHSTGGLTVAGKDGYRWDPIWIQNAKASVPTIAAQMMKADDRAAIVSDLLGFELNAQEGQLLDAVTTEMSSRDVENVIKGIVNERTNTGWTTNGHTAVDVNIYGYGPGADKFKGNLDNIEVAHRIFELLEARD
ncbi:alkaline phosphatase [Glaciecola sp. XM2]|uniref:alkaline phosphatase n=1 Tax=Glaciecola sp. XM2 TaxID=1914931 RepID=UPI001BDE2A52|nr:alkaline phosphatase [Glaciecola sp. XM2]MBT1452405.1 alkaline phosphatase [Glaciecola sp. XM2]